MTGKNQVQLITYPDSLGGNLRALDALLEGPLGGLFAGGIHILPPFPSSGDRGFAPLTYLEIASEFGTWKDIQRIGRKSPVLLDLMVNHLSARSAYFQDFLKNGHQSEFADLFIPLGKVWSDGQPSPADMQRIFLRRTEPFSDFAVGEAGETLRVWTTFGKATPSEQIDIDVNSQVARRLLTGFLRKFAQHGVKMVRLDAVGYVTKRPGTTCFFVEPEIYEFLEWISGVASSLGVALLPEVHAEHETQFRLAGKGYWIYDFILPYMILDALFHRTSARLKEYLKNRPRRQFTMLDCHDGIPVKPDLNGMYQSAEARRVVDLCVQRGANLSRVFAPGHRDADGFDVHQIRGAIYSLLGHDDDAYLAARAIQLFTPGIPQVYYVGLLAGQNDEAAADRTGDGREVNRHNYSLDEVQQDLRQPVVQRLIRLIRLRNELPAFDGAFQVEASDDASLQLFWENGLSKCQLAVDLSQGKAEILFTAAEGEPANINL